uniref:Amidase n=1 Tax=Riptortus pedestris TaxID=329032 RepID=R4WS00_RIPPE|nr:amidase [Riptortus pedestris]
MEITVRMIGALQLFISWLLWPYYFILSLKRIKPLPPIKSQLLEIPAVELARKIRHRQISSKEVVEAYIQRIRDVNPILNAVVEYRFREALEDAEKVDQFLSSTNTDLATIEKETPLLGVPITVKESLGLKGYSHCVGSIARKGVKSSDHGESVENVIKAGGIPIAVTTTPEYCMSWETSNNVTGVTNNPYDPLRTPGGSSGGEGALLGSGASLIGLGSDIAGSIRIPAMFNGVYGHKPSPGFVSIKGHFPNSTDHNFNNYLVCGPMTRYVDDLKPLLKIMAGEKAAGLRLDEEVDISKLKIFYKEDAGFSLVAVPVDWEIKAGIRDAASFLEKSYNCQVKKANIKELEDSVEISTTVFLGMEGIPNIMKMSQKENEEEQNLYHEIWKSYFGKSDYSLSALLFMFILKYNLFIPRTKYPFYCKQNEELRTKFNNLLGENGVFIYPTYPIPALYHNETFNRIAGIMYTMIFNTLRLPSTHVPIGLDRHGLPIGLQIIAGEKQDRLCMAVAKALDARFGGWVPPPSEPIG